MLNYHIIYIDFMGPVLFSKMVVMHLCNCQTNRRGRISDTTNVQYKAEKRQG